MGRIPCCEKEGLKRGPWAAEEDMTLIAYIQRYGHANWRALPKQAGLLRCGKGCRLRWINYLRPDVKRGNFTADEEEAIIKLHQTLGNRWSAIAARLPGRTDNEIKNVWHTYLKKRRDPTQTTLQTSKRKKRADVNATMVTSSLSLSEHRQHQTSLKTSPVHVSAVQSCGHLAYVETVAEGKVRGSREECINYSSEFIHIDESFWSEALSMDKTSEMNTHPSSPLGDLDDLFNS